MLVILNKKELLFSSLLPTSLRLRAKSSLLPELNNPTILVPHLLKAVDTILLLMITVTTLMVLRNTVKTKILKPIPSLMLNSPTLMLNQLLFLNLTLEVHLISPWLSLSLLPRLLPETSSLSNYKIWRTHYSSLTLSLAL